MAVDSGPVMLRGHCPEARPDLLLVASNGTVRTGPGRFSARRGPNWTVIACIAAAHALLLAALMKFDVIIIARAKPPAPLVVEMLKLPTEPPPRPVKQDARPEPVEPQTVAPVPVVVTPAPPPVIAVSPEPPTKPVIETPPAALPSPVADGDLDTRTISAPPPRYPVMSLRLREEGTVILSVLVGTDGRVSEIAISRSSGFARLDKAALEAVRRWRWSPLMRNGAALMVRGVVDIPFILRG